MDEVFVIGPSVIPPMSAFLGWFWVVIDPFVLWSSAGFLNIVEPTEPKSHRSRSLPTEQRGVTERLQCR